MPHMWIASTVQFGKGDCLQFHLYHSKISVARTESIGAVCMPQLRLEAMDCKHRAQESHECDDFIIRILFMGIYNSHTSSWANLPWHPFLLLHGQISRSKAERRAGLERNPMNAPFSRNFQHKIAAAWLMHGCVLSPCSPTQSRNRSCVVGMGCCLGHQQQSKDQRRTAFSLAAEEFIFRWMAARVKK